jgi:hypothetical protein
MTIDASKVTCETMATKIKSTSNSRPHTYFTKHLVGVTDNPPHEYNENPENSSLSSDGSRMIPASTCKSSHSNGSSTKLFTTLQAFRRTLGVHKQEPRKSSIRSSRRRKSHKTNKDTKSGKLSQNGKEELEIA